MSMAASQGWDANLLCHSLEFNHRTIFSLALVLNLDKFKGLDVYPKPIRSVLPPQTTSLCTTGLAPPPEVRPSKLCLLSHIHHLIFNTWWGLSALPGWPLSQVPEGWWRNHFGFQTVSAPRCISGQLGGLRGQLRALPGRDPSVQNMLCSCYKKALWDLKSASVRNFPFRQKLTQLCKKVLNVHGKMMLFQEARQWLHFLNLQSFSSNK